MFNKELKEEIENIKKFLADKKIAASKSLLVSSYEFDCAMMADSKIKAQYKRISELEAKVAALMELLAVKEVQPETERKLKKGNKEVVIGKKYIVWEGRK